MKFCPSLYGSLIIDSTHLFLCCTGKQNKPSIPWDFEAGIRFDRLKIVRDALINGFHADLNKPVQEYNTLCNSNDRYHPCKECRHIVEVPDDYQVPSTSQLTCLLNITAYTYCNARCIYCYANRDINNIPVGREAALDRALNKILMYLLESDSISRDCEVCFSAGEVSISKESKKALAVLVNNGYKVFINTNAILFSPEIEKALRSGLGRVQISIDSGDRQSFRDVKGIDKFESVAANIDRYNAASIDSMALWLKYIVFSVTRHKAKLDAFINMCSKYNIKNVSVSTNSFEGEVGNEYVNEEDNDATLRAYAYLVCNLELIGVRVFQEYNFLTKNEIRKVKSEHAKAVMSTLGYSAESNMSLLNDLIHGFDMAALPTDNPDVKQYMYKRLEHISMRPHRIALFGAGGHAKWIKLVMDQLGITPVAAFDNNLPALSPFDFPVVKPSEISKYDVDMVIVASNAYHLNIYSQLVKMEEFSRVRIIDPYLNVPG